MTETRDAIWPCLTYTDAPAALEWLEKAFGFEPKCAYAMDGDESVIHHAEMRWPLGGGIMFGSAGKDDGPFGTRPVGQTSIYVVCDDPDALFERCTGQGAEVVRELHDTDYGSRDFVVRDPEGNLWSFGTYAGE